MPEAGRAVPGQHPPQGREGLPLPGDGQKGVFVQEIPRGGQLASAAGNRDGFTARIGGRFGRLGRQPLVSRLSDQGEMGVSKEGKDALDAPDDIPPT